MITKRSPYLFVKDGFFRMLIRGLYAKYLDELYVPKGSRVYLTYQPNYKTGYRLFTPQSGVRRGVMEVYFDR